MGAHQTVSGYAKSFGFVLFGTGYSRRPCSPVDMEQSERGMLSIRRNSISIWNTGIDIDSNVQQHTPACSTLAHRISILPSYAYLCPSKLISTPLNPALQCRPRPSMYFPCYRYYSHLDPCGKDLWCCFWWRGYTNLFHHVHLLWEPLPPIVGVGCLSWLGTRSVS